MIDSLLSHAYSTPMLLAALGGFMLNMMNLHQDQQRPKSARTEKNALYWLMFVFWPLAGAILAFVYLLDGSKFEPMTAFIIGVTAPTTLQAMLQATDNNNKAVVGKSVED